MDQTSQDYIYLDYAATSPMREEVLEEMLAYMQAGANAAAFTMNPNSLHSPGRAAFKALESARRRLACALDAGRPGQIAFTSGATEADNSAIMGIARAVRSKRNLEKAPHIIVSAIEHDAVVNVARNIRKEGFEVTFVRPDRDGFIETEALEEAMRPETLLVSIQMANSEIGSIQAIEQLADAAHAHGAYLHTDATQALGKTDVSLQRLGVDSASFSAHKVGGPRGMGALFIRSQVPFQPLLLGGGQESALRSGTQDVAGAVGFAKAAELAVGQMEDERRRLSPLRDKLYADLATFDRIQPTVEVEPGSLDYLPNIVNFMVKGMESETAVIRFDKLGFAVSGGSACSSKDLDASHVLMSMGISESEALGEVRVSMGEHTTQEHVNAFLRVVPKVLDWD